MVAQSMSLIAADGTRKYLTAGERTRFFQAIPILADPLRELYCEMLFWTGCRPSEALALTRGQIDSEDGAVVFRTLKKRGSEKGRHFRQVPVPNSYLEKLTELFQLRDAERRLWLFSRSTAWRAVRTVMQEADLYGIKACSKGLRHSYGVTAALNAVPETRIKKWLGHASLATTEIYLDMAGPEDRALAARMWEGEHDHASI